MSSAVMYLTNECNIRCKHCFVGNDQLRRRDLLTAQEIAKILRNLAHNGIKNITLLGGEVTGRKDIEEIISFCDELGIGASINTNLLSFAAVEPLLDHSSLINLVVSLDGLTSASHDKVRGTGTFVRTYENLKRLLNHERVKCKQLRVDLTFVLTQYNKADLLNLPRFAKKHSINKINFKTLQFNDRALTNKATLALSPAELLDICTAFYFACMLEGQIRLDMYIPPAYGYYLERIAGVPKKAWNYNACGGTEVYSYVDLYGNNLPCPAMSLEENNRSSIGGRSVGLNLIENDLSSVRRRSLFRGFDLTVKKKSRNLKMKPCHECRFSDVCSPCTNEIIRGASEGTVELCESVRLHGDTRIPGISTELFGRFDPTSEARPGNLEPVAGQ
jgi:MoaA/NifB/PqqE/SkfB family radical SAM enzyme